MTKPSLIPAFSKRTRVTLLVVVGGALLLILANITSRLLPSLPSKQAFTAPIDKKFGEQNLVSSVALIELHKTRYGSYPSSLKDLKYTGDWGQMYLSGVEYHPSEDRQSYYVVVTRGWTGTPTLNMPDEFWQGTGYDENLKPTEEPPTPEL